MTPNQREDMDQHLKLEEKWRPLNRLQPDAYDVFMRRACWVVGFLAAICGFIEIVHVFTKP